VPDAKLFTPRVIVAALTKTLETNDFSLTDRIYSTNSHVAMC